MTRCRKQRVVSGPGPRALSILLLSWAAAIAQSATVKEDDLIVVGAACIGIDCPANIDFIGNETTLELRENNLRIRFVNTSAPVGLGQSWNLQANDSENGGRSYFRFEAKSVTEDTARLSDGTAPRYDCVDAEETVGLPAVIGVIAAGEPVVVPVFAGLVDGTLRYRCETTLDFTVKPMFSLQDSSDGGVTLGDSQPLPGVVSVGHADARRPLKNLGPGEAETDALTRAALDNYSLLREKKEEIAVLERRLAEMEALVVALEAFDADGDGSSTIDDDFPNAVTAFTQGSLGLSTTPATESSSCTIEAAAFGTLDGLPAPPATVTPIDMTAGFTLTGCAIGETVMIAVDFGTPLPSGYVAYKVGTDWQEIVGARIEGSQVHYQVQDGGLYDADGEANGVIVDPLAVGSAPVVPIPTLPLTLLALLTGLLGAQGTRILKRQGR